MTPSGAAVIRGTVTGGGAPLHGARVYVVRGPVPVPDIAALTAVDGSFALGVPAAGEYQIGSTADGFASTVVTVRVAAGGSAGVVIRLDVQ